MTPGLKDHCSRLTLLGFNQPSSDYLNRTPSSAGNQKTYTVSFWYKRTNFGAKDIIMSTTNGGSSFFSFGFLGSGTYADKFQFYWYDGTTDYGYHSARLFRDTSAWYHIVLAIDTTQGTESNRAKVYINGVQETLTATYGAFPQNLDTYFNKNNVHYIGYDHDSSGALLNGYLSEIINVDGSQLTPTSFGSTNSDGVWTPIPYTGTFGTNGFNLQFEDASSLGTDSSANGNNFTVNNLTSIDQSTDYPVVNFCTVNGIGAYRNQPTLSDGNLTLTGTGSGTTWNNTVATIGTTQGKWYYEFKITGGSQFLDIMIGIINTSKATNPTTNLYTQNGSCYIYGNDGGEMRQDGGETSNDYGAFAQNDIIGIAYDLDTFKFNVYKNGTQIVTNFALSSNFQDGGIIIPSILVYEQSVGSANFGNPPFSISSGNTDGNGYGNFEYSVPSGYYALNTANLAEFG